VNLATHLRLVPRLRMSGAILPLPSYALTTNLSLLQSVSTNSGTHAAYYSVGTGNKSGQGVNLATNLLVPRLRMSGAILPLPSYAFLACLGTTLHFFTLYMNLVDFP
jgi:hypothetical protein